MMIRELATEIPRDKGTESYNYVPVTSPPHSKFPLCQRDRE